MVGLAAAAALARAGRSVVLLERNAGLAQETTARTSEVVHAGIYYAPGSLKAMLCVAGRRALYERCEKLRIPHRRLGKLIVATDADGRAVLETLFQRGRENGVEDLRVIDAAEVRRREPEVRAVAALESPSTGIVDVHALCLSYAAEAERHGAALVLHTEAREIERRPHGYRLMTRGAAGDRGALDCGAVVNCLVNAAWSRGIGCVINGQGIMQSPVVREHARIPDDEVIMSCVAMGYPAEDFPANDVVSLRRPVDDVITFVGFDD